MNTTVTYVITGITIFGYLYCLRILYKNTLSLKIVILVGIAVLVLAIAVPFIAPVFTLIGIILPLINVYKLINKKGISNSKLPKKLKVKERHPERVYLETEMGTVEIGNIYRGCLIHGGAGSGKSRSLFYPIIEQLMKNEYSGILYDFKSPELTEICYRYASDKVKFHFLDFKVPEHSVRLNPLSPKYLLKQAYAVEYATALINNLLPESIKSKDFWTRSSIAIVSGTMWYLKKHHPEFCTLPHMVALILKLPSSQLIEVLVRDEETAGLISSLKEAHDLKAEKQIAGVVGTIKTAFASLNMPEVFYLLTGNETDLDINNPNDPKFLCIGTDSSLSDTYAPVISMIISVAMRQMNQPNKHKSAILIDEAPTLYIPNIEQVPATARSNKVATIMGVQDYSQLADKYGDSKAQVLISNLGNQFYGRTTNEKTAKQIVSLFGRDDVSYQSVSETRGRSVGSGVSKNQGNSITHSIQERDRVKTTSLINLRAGQFYALIAEGNTNELMGEYIYQTEIESKSIDKAGEVDFNVYFSQVYKDVESILTVNKITEPESDMNLTNKSDDIFNLLN